MLGCLILGPAKALVRPHTITSAMCSRWQKAAPILGLWVLVSQSHSSSTWIPTQTVWPKTNLTKSWQGLNTDWHKLVCVLDMPKSVSMSWEQDMWWLVLKTLVCTSSGNVNKVEMSHTFFSDKTKFFWVSGPRYSPYLLPLGWGKFHFLLERFPVNSNNSALCCPDSLVKPTEQNVTNRILGIGELPTGSN